MNKLLTLLLLLSTFSCFAQVDSTQIKLEQYKKWHEAGIISDEEYNQIKSKALGISSVEKPTTKSVSPFDDSLYTKKYVDKYRSQIIAGGVLLPIGGAFMVGAVMYDRYGINVDSRKETLGLLIATGVVVGITGAVLVGVGLHNREIYRHRNVTLTASVSLTTIGFRLTGFTGNLKSGHT